MDEVGELAAENSPDSRETFETPERRRTDMMPLADGRLSMVDDELEMVDTFELRREPGREPAEGRLSDATGDVLALRRSVILAAVEEEFMSDRGTASFASTSLR